MPNFKTTKFFIFLTCIGMFLYSCSDWNQKLELPSQDPVPVVECYLEPGQPYRLTLTQTANLFDTVATDGFFLEGATVTIATDGVVDTLRNTLKTDLSQGRFYNYFNPKLVPATVGTLYDLKIVLPNGNTVEAHTKMLDQVPIDSLSYDWSTEITHFARISTHFTDRTGEENYYHYVLNYKQLYDTLPAQDFIFDDKIFNTNQVVLTGGYDLRKNRLAIVTVTHISKDYYEFLKSIRAAVLGSQIPVVQPSRMVSNVSGTSNAVGIFTGLAFSRDSIRTE